LIKEVDLDAHVTFTGMLVGEDKLAALARASVFVLPSHSEGFSMATLEALACKVPVILSRGCSFDELRVWRAGFIFEDAWKDLGQILAKVITSPEIGHESRENGLRLVRDRYSLDVVGRKMLDLYHSIVS
jgi:glycosyltransferase involved in cell wall biosynthesis